MQIIYLKKFSISLGITLGLFLIMTLLATTLNYFNIVGNSGMGIFKMIIPIISMLGGGIYLGHNAKEKGWLEGIKLSITVILLFLLIHLIWIKSNFEIKNILYYFILLISGMIGSMIGINIKRKND